MGNLWVPFPGGVSAGSSGFLCYSSAIQLRGFGITVFLLIFGFGVPLPIDGKGYAIHFQGSSYCLTTCY